MSEDCGGCKFYIDKSQTHFSGHGRCRRYPVSVETHDGKWCGEFVAKPEKPTGETQ
jgi:hypothetical protein